MTLILKKVKNEELLNIYKLLKEQNFPNLPDTFEESEIELLKPTNHIYAGYTKEDKLVLFLCFCERNSKLYFDIACAKGYEGKWATKKVIKFIFNTAFKDLGYQDLFVESLAVKARKVVEKFGFEKLVNCFYKISAKSNQVLKYLKSK